MTTPARVGPTNLLSIGGMAIITARPGRLGRPASQDLGTRGSQEVTSNLQTPPYIRAEEAVRVRSGPDVDYPQVGRLYRGETAPVVGKNEDASWWQIEYAGAEDGLGWVTAEFVTLVGDAAAVPVVEE